MFVNLKNENTNQVKRVKAGFSWTTLLFGAFVPLFRADWTWFLLMLVSNIVLAFYVSPYGALGLEIVLAFIYNKYYIQRLETKGFKPMDEASSDILKAKNI